MATTFLLLVFLELDNIEAFSIARNLYRPEDIFTRRTEPHGWLFIANLFSIALELAQADPAYDGIAYKFFGSGGLWDERHGFLLRPPGRRRPNDANKGDR